MLPCRGGGRVSPPAPHRDTHFWHIAVSSPALRGVIQAGPRKSTGVSAHPGPQRHQPAWKCRCVLLDGTCMHEHGKGCGLRKMRSETRRRQTELPRPEFKAPGLKPLGRTYHPPTTTTTTTTLGIRRRFYSGAPSYIVSGCPPRLTRYQDVGPRRAGLARMYRAPVHAPPESRKPKGNFPPRWWILVVTGLAARASGSNERRCLVPARYGFCCGASTNDCRMVSVVWNGAGVPPLRTLYCEVLSSRQSSHHPYKHARSRGLLGMSAPSLHV